MKKLLFFCTALLISYSNFAQTVVLDLFASNFSDITEIVHAGDDRLFVTEQPGRIQVVTPNGSKSTFLDIRNIVRDGGERGLLGLAFAPDYSTTGRFYVNYTNNSGDTVIARYTVSSDPDVANTNGTILLTIDQPFSNHNGGKILFGPDGYLYVGMGDGGSGGDPQNNAQNPNTLLGKLLRIDVSGATYTNPPGNPYLSGGGEPEIYAIGLRNPWKISFDSATDDLWIADVGQNGYEEINSSDPTVAGLNFGWRCYEGMHPFNNGGSCPQYSNTEQPVSEYEYGNGPNGFRCSITGGYVYRGSNHPGFVGKYFFGDVCSDEIGILTNSNGNWTSTFQIPNIADGWRTFGEDNNGELYVASGSRIYELTDPTSPPLSTSAFSKNGFKLYPNPADDSVSIDLGKNYNTVNNLSIYNIQGQQVTNRQITQQKTTVSTQSLASGIYIVELSSNEGFKTVEKLVIK